MNPTKRVRASTPRTRTGCVTCRQRRVKCGEEKPACLRCIRSGWSCPGYTHESHADDLSQAPGANLNVIRASSSTSNITQYSIPFKVPGSQDERKALHYFSNFAAADLGGLFPSDFWSRTVLQRCQHDVPVRHAAAALGRAHMEYITTSDTTKFSVSEETAAAYRKAIKALRNYLGRNEQPDKSMVLMCSAVFFSFELIRAERRGALQHLSSALQILREWQENPAHSDLPLLADKDDLLAAFVRMDLQASVFDDERVPALREREDYPNNEMFHAHRPSPFPFKSLNEAHECLLALLHKTFVFLVENVSHKTTPAAVIPQAVSDQRAQLLGQFSHWYTRLELFQQNQALQLPQSSLAHSAEPPTMNHQPKALSVLKLHWLSVQLLLLHSLQDSIKANAPSFDDVADEQLQLARNIVYSSVYSDTSTSTPRSSTSSIDSDRRQAQQSGRSFTLHLGVVTPIFLLALKTCKTSVRAAAVDILLAARGWREGFYDAQAIAKLVAELEIVDEETDPRDNEAVSKQTRALEWAFHPAMNVSSWDNAAERLDGLERLWTAVA